MPDIPDGPAHYAAVKRLRSSLEAAERELLGIEGVSGMPAGRFGTGGSTLISRFKTPLIATGAVVAVVLVVCAAWWFLSGAFGPGLSIESRVIRTSGMLFGAGGGDLAIEIRITGDIFAKNGATDGFSIIVVDPEGTRERVGVFHKIEKRDDPYFDYSHLTTFRYTLFQRANQWRSGKYSVLLESFSGKREVCRKVVDVQLGSLVANKVEAHWSYGAAYITVWLRTDGLLPAIRRFDDCEVTIDGTPEEGWRAEGYMEHSSNGLLRTRLTRYQSRLLPLGRTCRIAGKLLYNNRAASVKFSGTVSVPK